MYRQYGVERDAPTGSLPSHDVQDQLVNAILDEELGRGHLDEAPAQETTSEPDLQPDAALPPEDGAQDPADLSSQPKKRGKRIAIIAGIVVAVLALAYGALALLDSGRILENVVVAGVDVGGMRKAEAITAVDAVAAAYEQNTMTLHFSDGDERITPQQSMLQLDVKGAVGAAYRYGRVLGVSIPGVTKAPAKKTAVDVEKYLSLDEDAIKTLLQKRAEAAESKLSQPTVEVKPMDEAPASDDVQTSDTSSDASEDTPEASADAGTGKAPQLMTITLGTADRRLDVDAAYRQILEAYGVNDFNDVTIDYDETLPEQVDVQALYDQYCTPAADAYYDTETYSIVPEVLGYGFDLDEVTRQVAEAEEGAILLIELKDMPPEMTEEKLKESLFSDDLSSYDSPHTAIPARTKNLELACAAIDGTILNPGDVFSFNDVVGERTSEKGYQPAAIYSSGTTTNEVGGGVCQVASTIYMCALKADLEIVERACHQFTVTYVPMGMDATVYWGYQDFKFRNNTEYPIRVDASVSGGYVHIKLCGTETKDYTIEMTYEILSTSSPTTIERVITDGSYANGEVIQAPHTGYRVVSYKHKIGADGKEISCDVEAYSTYIKTDRIIAVVQRPSTPSTPSTPDTPSTPSTPDTPSTPNTPGDSGGGDSGGTTPGGDAGGGTTPGGDSGGGTPPGGDTGA